MQNEEFEDELIEDNESEDTKNNCQNSIDFVKNCLDTFFQDKNMHCGGKIPKYILTDPKKINLVSKLSLLDGVDIAYESMKNMTVDNEEDEKNKHKNMSEITEDIKMVNETLKLLSKSGIPQKYAGGVMLIYLKYVKGIKINV